MLPPRKCLVRIILPVVLPLNKSWWQTTTSFLTPWSGYWQLQPRPKRVTALRVLFNAEQKPLFQVCVFRVTEKTISWKIPRKQLKADPRSYSSGSGVGVKSCVLSAPCVVSGWFIWMSFSSHWLKGVYRAARLLSDVSRNCLKSCVGGIELFTFFGRSAPLCIFQDLCLHFV